MTRFTALLLALPLTLVASAVEAAVIRVPSEGVDTVQAAVTTANPGDTIEVGAGRWCGAVISQKLTLVGRDAVIVGVRNGASCPPNVGGVFTAGFLLDDAAASGTTIEGFTFDGSDISTDGGALALAVYGRDVNGGKVNDVRVQRNRVLGTIQAVTNRGGDNWVVSHNHFVGVTSLSGMGGFGVAMAANGPVPSRGGVVSHNRFEGAVPADLPEWAWYAAVFLGGSHGVSVEMNKAAFAAGSAAASGTGVLVTTDEAGPAVGAEILRNDGSASDYVVVVEDGEGLVLRQNVGVSLVEGVETSFGKGNGKRQAKAERKAAKAEMKAARRLK